MAMKRKHSELTPAREQNGNDKESSREPSLVKDYPRRRVAIAVCHNLIINSLSDLRL
jgi:hypothetical protein